MLIFFDQESTTNPGTFICCRYNPSKELYYISPDKNNIPLSLRQLLLVRKYGLLIFAKWRLMTAVHNFSNLPDSYIGYVAIRSLALQICRLIRSYLHEMEYHLLYVFSKLTRWFQPSRCFKCHCILRRGNKNCTSTVNTECISSFQHHRFPILVAQNEGA